MKLRTASICIDCDEVFEGSGSDLRCPVCASRVTAFLSKWLMPLVTRDQAPQGIREGVNRGN